MEQWAEGQYLAAGAKDGASVPWLGYSTTPSLFDNSRSTLWLVHSIWLSPLARMALTSRSLLALPVTKTAVSWRHQGE